MPICLNLSIGVTTNKWADILGFFVSQIVYISFQIPLSTIKSYFLRSRGKVPKHVNILSLRISEKSRIIIFDSKYFQSVFLTVALSGYGTLCLHNPSFPYLHCNFWIYWQVFLKPNLSLHQKWWEAWGQRGWEECSFDMWSYFSNEVLRTRL